MKKTGRVLIVAISLALAASVGIAADGEEKPQIEAPSAYLEDIETRGSVGGVEDEVDSAEAQEEAEKAAQAPEEKPAE